jgi:RNA polymerase sigma factor (sigma-70 family)
MMSPGSPVAFDTFYRAEQEWLLGYFRKRVGPDDASDLMQEAFMRMLRSGALGRVDYPRPYLVRIARNLLINRVRGQRRAGAVFYPFDETCDAPVPPGQLLRMEELDIRRVIRPALLAMPPRTRRIFLMSRLRQQSYREIAEELSISEKTVEQHVSRALARCRRAFVAGRLNR